MKHYAKMSGWEEDMLVPEYRRCYGGKAETLAWAKHTYRKRERRTLKRMLADEIEMECNAIVSEAIYNEKMATIELELAARDYYEVCEEELQYLVFDPEYGDYIWRNDVPANEWDEWHRNFKASAERLDAAEKALYDALSELNAA